MKTTLKLAGAALAATLIGGAQPSLASSHREAPLISDDPSADSTDFYVFRTPSNDPSPVANSVTFVANYWPMQEPGGGPNWVRFGDSVLYEIKIDNNGDAVEDISYQFRFTTNFKKATTSFLFAGGQVATTNATANDPALNVVQNYTVTRVDKAGSTVVVANGIVPPPYTGDFTMQSAANYDAIAASAIGTVTTGGKVFAGQRDDPFFADLGGIFDLVRIRCTQAAAGGANKAAGCAGGTTKGVDFLGGYNVHSIVLQVPIKDVTVDGMYPATAGKNAVIGAWTTASRQRVTIRRAPTAGAALGGVKVNDSYGQWVQVSRLGLPLINEVIIPVGLKDYYNTTPPSNDEPLFTSNVGKPLLQDPELARAVTSLYSGVVTTTPTTRTDLLDLTQFQVGPAATPVGPFKGGTTAYALKHADILRVDLSVIAPTSSNPNRQGALAPAGMADPNVGFPNGRRLGDDVVDILERVVAGGVLAGNTTAINGALGDSVDANDVAFMTSFPYVPAPWSGSKVGNALITGGGANLLHQYQP